MRRIQIGSLFDKIRRTSKRKKITLIAVATVLVLGCVGLAVYLSRPDEAPKQEAAAPPNCFVITNKASSLVYSSNKQEAQDLLRKNESICMDTAGIEAKAKAYSYSATFAYVLLMTNAQDKKATNDYATKAKQVYLSMSEEEKKHVQDSQRTAANLITVLSELSSEADNKKATQ